MEHLDIIFNKYNTDKNTYFHNYTRQYNTLLNDFRNKSIKYLEIGVFNGGSVKAFREAFKKSTCILGLDIDNRCKTYEDVENNIFIEIGDATDANFIQSITKKSRKNVDELEAMVATCEEFMGSFVILGYSLEGEQIPPIVHCHNQQEADAIGNYLQKFIHYNIRSNDNMD